MNIAAKDKLAEGVAVVDRKLDEAGTLLATAIIAASDLMSQGTLAAQRAGISPGLIGSVLDYAGRMQADLGHAALMLQGVHASLHEALERLSPTEERSGPGDKTPPPKP